ncbi:sigma 54-interacting transcriptional regulator [Desulfovibrio subterraneus]|uniref:sigma-54 interaction domain-containing protein n=1 Tax=Desulfovibrio subterraneus TaxID=2718620 RepID=UPI0022B8BCF1|nr:sigma 54-interacting transcriptional regulator [Desulfovibrio subterraneus]WBF68588.1 sigma 54-interacting transcriptional regulator [Desulfovibrio subterraneus]
MSMKDRTPSPSASRIPDDQDPQLIPTLHSVDVSPFLDLMLGIARERTIEGILRVTKRTYRGRHVIFGGLWIVASLRITGTSDYSAPGADRKLRLMAFSGAGKPRPAIWRHKEGTYDLVPFSDPLLGPCTKGEPSYAASGDQWDRPDWAVEYGYHAYSAFPIMHKDELLGVMAVFYDRPMVDELADMLLMHRKMHKIYADSLAAAVANAAAFDEIQTLRRELELENEHLRRAVRTAHADDHIVGNAPALHKVMEQIEVVAPTDATVLILGESGTGKELLAEAIHKRSHRRMGPLVRVNCSAVPHELFESEFFGHIKGSFTGAVRDRTGRFLMADGGTLFLDEVGEIPLELQGKLLRVLQEGTFEPIGDDRPRKVDVRIVAATNRDLAADVEAGLFRQDLYFRLSVFPLHNPPLRERLEDIPVLAHHFVSNAARRLGVTEPKLHYRHIQQLQAYDWPGNVRELQNEIERAVIMSHNGGLEFNRLGAHRIGTPPSGAPHMSGTPHLHAATPAYTPDGPLYTEMQMEELHRENTVRALEACGWRVQGEGGAAELLGIKPTTLQSRIKKYGLKKPAA